jgi:hypothetical protein
MKIIKYKLIVIACIFFLAACEKDYDSFITKVTYYPEIEMLGEPLVFVPSGGSYDDPGAISIENGEEIETQVSSNVDYSTPGDYSIDYTAENTDGYTKTDSRRINKRVSYAYSSFFFACMEQISDKFKNIWDIPK